WMLPLLYLRPDFDGYLYAEDPTTKGRDLDDFDREDLVEAALLLPDYSTDPEIAGLAAELLIRQAGDSGLDAPSESVPKRLGTRSSDSTAPLYDWLQDSETPEDGANATVANLVQQLSQPSTNSSSDSRSALGGDRPLAADPTEDLRPQPAANPREDQSILSSSARPSSVSMTEPTRPAQLKTLQRRWSMPDNRLVWGSLSLAGLGAVLGLAIITLSMLDRSTPSPIAAVAPVSNGDAVTDPITDTALLTSAINALTLDRTATARTLIEQMLDRTELTTAASALATASEPQQQDPDIAYVRGRLAWQQMIGDPALGTSPNDALRAWLMAVESRRDFLEAWVALGFAHYALGDSSQAIDAWERAIALDQAQRRDIDPEADIQVANPITVNAYAGLAMAYQNESDMTIVVGERSPIQQQASSYYLQALTLDPALVNPTTLALHWLWSPALIDDWQTTLTQLAVGSANNLPNDAN
ncbi:MAG: tetratricopeptide repeat protein, partial [Nodosilinea sp.]